MTINSVRAAFPKGLSLFLCLSLACPASLWANPVGGVVVGGDANATIAYGGTTVINQTASRAVIDWTSFSIAFGETTQFNLDPGAAVLNRVSAGGGLSSILGTLSSANGSVFLINPNGILVGPTGVVNTQGFVASTLDLGNADFLLGSQFTFTGPLVSGTNVRNEGSITAPLGDVVLIGQTVSNAGTISAPNGTAALAAGSEVLYKPLDEEKMFVQAGIADADAIGVDQTATIQAAAAELKAAGGNVYSLAINNSGTINADQVGIVGGRIYLLAEDGLNRGTITNSGTLATTKGAFGGEVFLSGDQVTIEGLSSIAAADLQATGDTQILLNADISTNGSQTYNGPVVLGGARTLTSTAGNITFNASVESADLAGVSLENGLAVAAAAGLVSINGAMGGVYALGGLDVSGAQVGLNAGVTTTGNQNYNGAVDVGADAALNAGGSVYFGGTVDSANLSALTVNAGGYIDFAAAVGAGGLGNLTLTAVNGATNGDVWFETTLDSDGAVIVNADGITEFWDTVGARALGDLAVTGGGYIWFYGALDSAAGGAVSLTSLADVVFDVGATVGAVSLGGLTIDGAYVKFGESLDSDGAVSVTASNWADFYAPVGVRALDSLSVVSPAGIYLAGGSVDTTGAQTYDGSTSFGGAAQFTSAGGSIGFLSLVDTSGLDLTVDAGAGSVTFGGGATAGNLTVAGGDIQWDGSLSGADVLLTGTNLIMNGDVNSTGVNGVVMVAVNSFDNTSASAITTDPLARWLVYSDAAALDVAGGLTGGSEQGVSYPQAPAFAGNGFLYATAAPAADQPTASELDSFEASLVPPPVLVAAEGGGSDGGWSEDSGSGDAEEEKDGDK